jgi:DNA-binding MarR family transcriptional regulator
LRRVKGPPESEPESGKGPSRGPDRELGPGPGKGPGKELGRELSRELDRDMGRDGRGPGRGPGRGLGRGPGRGPDARRPYSKLARKFGPDRPDDVVQGLMMTARMIHRFGESRIGRHKQFSKLSRPRMAVLFIVHMAPEGSIRMGDLAHRLHVVPRTVTDLVEGLERDGFLHRLPDPEDRRAFLITLTASTKTDFDKISELRQEFEDEIISVLSAPEKETLILLLNKLRNGPLKDLLEERDCRME